MPQTAIVWFRRDLRLADNAALAAALTRAHGVAPLFVLPEPRAPHAPGAASRAWLAESLASLAADLRACGSSLAVREGPAPQCLAIAAAECGATLVTCMRDWTPAGLAEERSVASALGKTGVELRVDEGQLLVAPGAIATASGGPFRVFTPFWKAWRRAWPAAGPFQAPSSIPAPERPLRTSPAIVARAVGAIDVCATWAPGEAGANARLEEFARDGLAQYGAARDLPSRRGTSELSPHLAWGELSPRQVAFATESHPAAEPFMRQLAWREFAYHVLAAHPSSLDEPLRPEFSAMAWREDAAGLDAWREGRTGFPLVDAGMRQLAQTGWMHNRVRMVAASLLTKDLLVRWQDGERVFAEMLADLDPALNAFNWQWVAGSGADAAPYFRIFNPTLQAQRFDPNGDFIRRWVPELSRLSAQWICRPWDAPAAELSAAGVTLGSEYPRPIVDHAEARQRALAAFSAVKGARTTSAS